MSSGTWTTTKGGGLGITISTGGVVALIAAGYALTHPKQAAAAASGVATIAAITIAAITVAVIAVVVLKLRGRSRNTAEASQPVSLMRRRTDANVLPPREARAIAAPVQPIVNVNIGADLLAGLMEAARQQQPVPVYVQSETVQQQEIPR